MSVLTADALVVGPVETSTAVSGTLLVESLVDLSTAIRDESWLDVGLCVVSTVLDAAAAVMDPIGTLIGAGLGWVMEHVEPLKGWLEELTGDAGAVLGCAGTWDNIAAELTLAGDDYARVLHADVGGMSGEGVAAYVRFAEERIAEMRGLAESSSAVAGSLRTASTIVQVVHDLVRDALAELVGAAISWALQAALSLGTATPWVVSQVATRVASLATRVGASVTALINSVEALGTLVRSLDELLAGLAAGMAVPGRAGRADGQGEVEPVPVPPVRAPAPARPTFVTPPSRSPDPDAVPGGRVTTIGPKDDIDTKRSLTRENEAAVILARFGYDIEQNPVVPGPKNPDYRIEGRIFDNVAPITDSARNVWSRVEEKILDEQTTRVVLTLDDCPVPMADLEAQFRDWRLPGLEEVIIVINGEVLPFFPISPKGP